MMIKEITEKSEWEGFISGSNIPVSFFQSWSWGEFERMMGAEVFRLGFFEEQLAGVAQAFLIKAKRGRFLHVRNGPVLKWDDKGKVKLILDELRQFAVSKECDFMRISPLVGAGSEEEASLTKYGFVNSQMHDVDAEITWVLDLDQEPDAILANMRKTTRYLIRKAIKDNEIEVVRSTNVEDLKNFWPIYEHTVRRQGWSAYNFKYLETEFSEFLKNNMAQLFLAKYQGQFIAGSIFIYYQGQSYYHHSGSLSEFHKVPAMYLLQWESILEAKKRGLKKYNFFGIARDNDPKHPWYGLSLFKKGFGGSEEVHMHAKDLPIKSKYWLTHYYERFERWKRGYK